MTLRFVSMGFSRQGYGVGCHFLLQGNLPDPGIEPGSPTLHPGDGEGQGGLACCSSWGDRQLVDLYVELAGLSGRCTGVQHRLNGHEFEQIPGDGEGQGGLACCSP